MRRAATAVLVTMILAGPALSGVVAGKVVDETGKPLLGVEVSVHDPERGQWIVRETVTGGRFSLAGHWEKPVPFIARKEGYLPVELEAVGPIVKDLVVVLRKPGRIAGRVVGRDGSPHRGRVLVNLRPVHPELSAGIVRVQAREDGGFVIEKVRPGLYDLLAVPHKGPPGILRGIRVPPEGRIEVLMPDTRTLVVKLRDAEKAPVPHAKLSLRYLSERWALGRPPIEGLTDLKGTAYMENVPDTGGGLLLAVAGEHPPIVRRLDLDKEGEVVLTLPTGCVLEGRGPGKAAEGGRVAWRWDRDLPGTTTNRIKAGRYVFDGLAPGLGIVEAEHGRATHFGLTMVRPRKKRKYELGSVPGKPLEVKATIDGSIVGGDWLGVYWKTFGFAGARGRFEGGTAAATGLATDRMRLFFRRGEVSALAEVTAGRRREIALASHVGRGVVRVDGKAARGAMVLLVPADGPYPIDELAPPAEPTRTDSSGRFETPRFAGGPWALLALDEAHAPVLTVLPDGPAGNLVIDLVPGALLRVRVRDPGDRPVVDARVHAYRDGVRFTAAPRRTDRDGIALLLLPPGKWDLAVFTPDLGLGDATVKLGVEGAEVVIEPRLR